MFNWFLLKHTSADFSNITEWVYHKSFNKIMFFEGLCAPTLRARDKMPQAVLFPTVSLLSNHTNLEPWMEKSKRKKNIKNYIKQSTLQSISKYSES